MELDFKDFYSFGQYTALVQVEELERQKEEENYENIFKAQEPYEQGMLNYLKARAKNNMLFMPENSNTHESHLLTQWQHLVDQKLKSHEENRIIYLFSKLLSYNMMNLTNEKEPITIEENYQKLIDKVNKGDFQRFDLDCDNDCFCCGQKMRMAAKDWRIKLFTADINKENKIEFKLLPECIERKVYEVNVEFKTGQLLMADWFRIPEFTKQVEYNTDYNEVSINHDLGKIKSTEHAAKLGFVTVHIGNSSPTIFQQEDNFLFGHEKEDSHINDYKDKGYICTDLWNATIIDKSRLIEIVANKLGEDKAKATVEKYLEEQKNNINFITVQSGKYNIKFAPNKDISDIDKELPQEIDIMFSMTKELPKKKLKM